MSTATTFDTNSTHGNNGDNNGTSFVDQAKEKAQQVAQQIQPQTGKILDSAKSKINESLHTQKEQATGTLHGVAEALRTTGQQLNNSGQGTFGGYADTLAGEVEKIGAYLRERDVTDLAAELGSFAKRQPTLFISSAFVLGVLAARFLKASNGTNGFGSSFNREGALVPMSDTYAVTSPGTAPYYANPSYVGTVANPASTPASSPEVVLPTSFDEGSTTGTSSSKTGFVTDASTKSLTDSTLVD